MAQQDLDYGNAYNSTSDKYRDAFAKIQHNFDELYAAGGPGNGYARLIGGTTRGAVNTNVVRYATLAESWGTPGNFTVEHDSDLGDSILVNVAGLYLCQASFEITPASWEHIEIRIDQDGVIDNVNNDANSRAHGGVYGGGLVPGTCGNIIAAFVGARIWSYCSGAPNSSVHANQMTIVGPFFLKQNPPA